MGYDQHLFISYAHIDNQPLSPEQRGWITRFHQTLEAILGTRLGREARIWRDDKLRGNDVFGDEIVEQFPRTALLVSVVSPRYVESEWCTREVREFCTAAEQRGGLVVDNKSRIFKVIKTPVETEEPLPPVMRRMTGYEFFTFDNDAPLELDPAYGEALAQKYNLKVAKLAWDVAQLIRKLENGNGSKETSPAAAPAATVTRPPIYLAECSYDCRESREALEADLRLQGYSVLPEHRLPRDEAEYVAEAEKLIRRCQLSIHLIGTAYGAVPDGPSNKSVVVLQNELAIRRSREAGLKRVIWLPESTSSQHAGQQEFITALHNDANTQYGADLITGDVETLKGAIHATLAALQKSREKPAPAAASSSGLVFLICDERDRTATVPLRRHLTACGFEVEIPVFEGDAATVREANRDLLQQSDAVLIFYGQGDEAWKRTVQNELRKLRSVREKAWRFTGTYLAQPLTSDKRDLLALERADVLDGLAGFTESALERLIQAMRR